MYEAMACSICPRNSRDALVEVLQEEVAVRDLSKEGGGVAPSLPSSSNKRSLFPP